MADTSQKTAAQTQIAGKKQTATHIEDQYHVIIGFEVNKPNAYIDIEVPDIDINELQKSAVRNNKKGIMFEVKNREAPLKTKKEKMQDLSVDAGHAFIYITKNRKVMAFLSVGPTGHSKDDWFGAYTGATPDYDIPEVTRLFRLNINKSQFDKMHGKIMEYRRKINAGQVKYNASPSENFTCAKTARDVLAAGWTGAPSGAARAGFKKHIGSLKLDADAVDIVAPYPFYHQLKQRFPTAELVKGADKQKWRQIMTETQGFPGSMLDPLFDK